MLSQRGRRAAREPAFRGVWTLVNSGAERHRSERARFERQVGSADARRPRGTALVLEPSSTRPPPTPKTHRRLATFPAPAQSARARRSRDGFGNIAHAVRLVVERELPDTTGSEAPRTRRHDLDHLLQLHAISGFSGAK